MKSKKISDVLGVIIRCPNYSSCPICYGCRNYSTSNLMCLGCAKDKKNNICNVSTHVTKSISIMITKNRADL